MGYKIYLALLFLIIFNVSMVSSELYNDCELYGICKDEVTIATSTFNNNTGAVNTSVNWDGARTWNETQSENEGGILTIKEGWLALLDLWEDIYCRLTGCTMTGDLVMDNADINVTGNLNVNGDINFTKQNNNLRMYTENDYFVVEG